MEQPPLLHDPSPSVLSSADVTLAPGKTRGVFEDKWLFIYLTLANNASAMMVGLRTRRLGMLIGTPLGEWRFINRVLGCSDSHFFVNVIVYQ